MWGDTHTMRNNATLSRRMLVCKISSEVMWARKQNLRQSTKTKTDFLQEKVDNNQSQEKRMFHCIMIRTSIRKSSLYKAWKEVKSSDECL